MRILWAVLAAVVVVAMSVYLSSAYRNPMYAVLGLAAGLVVVIGGLASMMVKRRSGPPPSSPPPPT
ncbi:MAG TPA: hypothetical protein VM286_04795 [Candidatus Thermoplasmatota archaeon]|nr:hypothetical protein [Candidatus Thermoplasmatota archaeon]